MSDIRIYTTTACGYCHAAKSFLKRAELRFEEIDLTMDLRGRDALVRRTGPPHIPAVLVDGQAIGGYQELTQAIHAGDLRPSHPQAAA